ncbi:MAG: glycosyltransferase [Candidatus Promineifilaceae bacterium]|nr:glycosyltransferase [Candidatus Promineifilaceae bacterium]
MIDLSVIIPTHQRNGSLKTLLLALEEQSLPPSRYEVVVAVDGQVAETVSLLRTLQPSYRLHWLVGSSQGPGAARNRGVAMARGRLLLFLDDDMLPAPELLATHLHAHADHASRLGLGQVRVWPRQPLSAWERYLNDQFETHYDKMACPDHQPTFWDCLSGNLSLTRQLFLGSGGFDPVFGQGKHEDIELGYRLHALGVQFHYLPEALSYHRFAKSQAAGLRDSRRNGASSLQFVRRFPELFPQLLQARWQRYPWSMRRLLAAVLPLPGQRRRLARQAALALAWIERSSTPGHWRRPVYRLAYHLHFWQGLAQVAEAQELHELLLRLRRRSA